jgi:hypothetical protein
MVSSSCTREALSAVEKWKLACGERYLLEAASSPCDSAVRPTRKDFWWVLTLFLEIKNLHQHNFNCTYFFKIHSNTVVPPTSRFTQVVSFCLFFSPTEILYLFFASHMCAAYPDHLIFHISATSSSFPFLRSGCSAQHPVVEVKM